MKVRPIIKLRKEPRKLIKTILNHVQKFKSFVYTKATLIQAGAVPELEIEIKERANSQAVCSGCGQRRSGYDRQPRRRYEFVPLWGIKVFFCYAPRRVNYPLPLSPTRATSSGP